MYTRSLILMVFVVFLGLSISHAADDDLRDIVGRSAAMSSRSVTAESIAEDDLFKELFSKAGEELKPGDSKSNYFTAMKIAKDHNLGDLDAFLNQMGIRDTYPINSGYTGENKSEDAYNVWMGQREGKRLEEQASAAGHKIEKGAKTVKNVLKGVF